jgi:hypothetical protein
MLIKRKPNTAKILAQRAYELGQKRFRMTKVLPNWDKLRDSDKRVLTYRAQLFIDAMKGMK